MVKKHGEGEIFCSCNACPHGGAFQCEDYRCNCCTGTGGTKYQVTYLKDSGPPAFNF